jgi:hypothetical protein
MINHNRGAMFARRTFTSWAKSSQKMCSELTLSLPHGASAFGNTNPGKENNLSGFITVLLQRHSLFTPGYDKLADFYLSAFNPSSGTSSLKIMSAEENQAEHEQIATSLEVETIEVNLFRSKSLFLPFRSRGVFGGFVSNHLLCDVKKAKDKGISIARSLVKD